MITKENLDFAYNNFKEGHNKISSYEYGRFIGYFEACLLQFNKLDTEKQGNATNIKRLVLKPKTFFRKEVKESTDEAIIRMVGEFLKSSGE